MTAEWNVAELRREGSVLCLEHFRVPGERVPSNPRIALEHLDELERELLETLGQKLLPDHGVLVHLPTLSMLVQVIDEREATDDPRQVDRLTQQEQALRARLGL